MFSSYSSFNFSVFHRYAYVKDKLSSYQFPMFCALFVPLSQCDHHLGRLDPVSLSQ